LIAESGFMMGDQVGDLPIKLGLRAKLEFGGGIVNKLCS
jgi:hypothetical protein